jgi:signal transduction histidine kinase
MNGGKRFMSIAARLYIALAIVFFVVAVSVITLVGFNIREHALEEARAKVLILLNRNFATHTYFNQNMKPKIFRWTEPFRTADYFDPSWMSSTYAVREIDLYFRRAIDISYYYKECAISARSPENEADDYERAFMEEMNRNPGLKERAELRTIDGQIFYAVMIKGEVMEESCLRCHSTPDQAPKGLVDHYGAERSFHRKLGDIASAISIRIPVGEAYREADRLVFQVGMILLFIFLCMFIVVYFVNRNILLRPLSIIRDKALEIAKSGEHLGEEIPMPAGRELKDLTAAFNVMSVNLSKERELLEARVQERTKELAAAEKESKDYAARLEESNRDLQHFAFVASHDLQEPLRMVASFLKLLERNYKGRLDADADEFIHYALDGANRMRNMILGLLDYSRVQSRGGPVETLDCEALLGEVLNDLKISIEESGAKITHGHLPGIPADRPQMQRVFQNLISNAVRFRGTDAPRIHISAERKEGEWVFSVKDNGIGIAPDYCERIFLLFQRAHNKSISGDGMGLALCRRIVQRHGGRIWVSSAVGEGSTFFFSIPDLIDLNKAGSNV